MHDGSAFSSEKDFLSNQLMTFSKCLEILFLGIDWVKAASAD